MKCIFWDQCDCSEEKKKENYTCNHESEAKEYCGRAREFQNLKQSGISDLLVYNTLLMEINRK